MSHARPYTKITRYGSSFITNDPCCIVEEMVEHHLWDEDDEPAPEFSVVFMTDAEYEALPEFQGW